MKLDEKVFAVLFACLMAPLVATLYLSMEKNLEMDSQMAAFYYPVEQKTTKDNKTEEQKQNQEQKYKETPKIVQAVYITRWSAANEDYIKGYLAKIIKGTTINAVVIDVKDYTGKVVYNKALLDWLHEQNIYTIARISVFQDQEMAKQRPDLAIFDNKKTSNLQDPVLWKDNNGLAWMDPASTEIQEYNISVAKNALEAGFDEINFDYVRFPSDGELENMGFPFWNQKTQRHEAIRDFFAKTRQQLSKARLSADLFGQATTQYNDMGIGQILEDFLEFFDFVCPMIYPSHFAQGFIGFKNPAEHPYEIIKYSMDSAKTRKQDFFKVTAGQGGILRPWLQDFDMGAEYTADMVKQQINAAKDSLGKDFSGFMIWSPSNIYETNAFLIENTEVDR